MNNNVSKECRRCHTDLPIEEFAAHRKTKDKLTTWCNSCRKIYALEKYQVNKEKDNERRRQYYKDNKK